jgi:hypothetical protein
MPARSTGISALGWFAICGGTVLVLLLGGTLLLALRSGGGSSGDRPQVEITSCGATDGRNARIAYEITNRGDSARTVFVDFSVTDSSGTRIGTGRAVESNIPPGRTVAGDTIVLLPEGRSGSRCGVDRVR